MKKHVTKVTTSGNYYLTDDGSKLTMTSGSGKGTQLKLYSNEQLWAISSSNNKEHCLHVEDKEKLQDLDGVEVQLKNREDGEIYFQSFEFQMMQN